MTNPRWCAACTAKGWTQIPYNHKQCSRCGGYFCLAHMRDHEKAPAPAVKEKR